MPASYSRSAPAAGELGGKSCTDWQRTEGRIHGGERGRGSRHKVGSSGSNHRSSSKAADTEAVPVRKSCKLNKMLDT